MIARALVALGGNNLSREDLGNGLLAECEKAEYEGAAPDTGDTLQDWENAKTAANIPDDGFVMHWRQVR